MDRQRVDPKVDPELQRIFNYLFDNGWNVPLELEETPTATNNVVPEGQVGIKSTKLYLTHKGTLYEISMVATA